MRPQTYEDAEEAKFLSYVYGGRSGLENTSFALLDPEGKKLTRGSRSPSMTYGTTERFVEALGEVSATYTEEAEPITTLPTVRDLRLALNVAAADMRPLIVVRGEDEEHAEKLAAKVAAFAWSEAGIGTSHYVVLAEETTFGELTPPLGVTVVQPDPYGLGGEVLAHASPTTGPEPLAKTLTQGIARHAAAAREHDDHIREARRRGIGWKPAVPVTDRDALEADRGRGRRRTGERGDG